MYFNIFVLFIVGTASISKLVLPVTYFIVPDCHLSGCVVAIIITVAFFLFF